jgi:hypothetical protein
MSSTHSSVRQYINTTTQSPTRKHRPTHQPHHRTVISVSTRQHNTSHQHARTVRQHQRVSTHTITSTRQHVTPQLILQSSTVIDGHQQINTHFNTISSIQQHINTSTRQCNHQTHQRIITMSSTHQHSHQHNHQHNHQHINTVINTSTENFGCARCWLIWRVGMLIIFSMSMCWWLCWWCVDYRKFWEDVWIDRASIEFSTNR